MDNQKENKCIICGNELKPYQIKRGITTCCRSCAMKKMWSKENARASRVTSANKEFTKQKKSESMRQYWSNEEKRLEQSEKLKQAYQNPELRQKLSSIVSSALNKPEVKQKISDSLKKAYENPELRQKLSESMKIIWSNEDFKQRQSETRKELWSNENLRKKQSEILRNSTDSLEYRQKRSNIAKQLWQNENYRAKMSESLKQAWFNEDKRAKILQRTHETKKQNNSYAKSSWEDKSYELLLTKFSKDDIICQYFDKERYPFNCDFYIKSLDLFIECHYGWHHNGHPFNETNQNDLDELALLQEKAQSSDNYKNKVYQWTNLDVRKRQYAKDNELNWIAFYSLEEFERWLNTINF